MNTKLHLKVFLFAVLPVLFYGCDDWFDDGHTNREYDGDDVVEFHPTNDSEVISADTDEDVTFLGNVNLISPDGEAQQDLDMDLNVAETNAEGDQFDFPGSVTIEAGETSADVPMSFHGDNIAQGNTLEFTVELTGGDVEPSANYSTFSFELEKEVGISGNVATEDGDPMEGITVTVEGGSAATDADGNYFISVPGGATYAVVPELPMMEADNGNGENPHVANDSILHFFDPDQYVFEELAGPETEVHFTGLEPVSISGTISDADDSGMFIFDAHFGEMTVEVYREVGEEQELFGEVTPNENGEYEVFVKPGENYQVVASAEDYAFDPGEISFEDIQQDETADFEAYEAIDIHGQVVDAETGEPVEGVTVELASGFDTQEAETGEDGSYLFRSSPGENYTITPSHDDYSFSPSSESSNNRSRDWEVNFEAISD